MKKLGFWLMSTKLNCIFFLFFGSFFTLIAIGFAENRFDHDLIVYLLLSITWLIVILNLISLMIIKMQIKNKKDISLLHKIFISMMMVGIVLVLFSSQQHTGTTPYHHPNLNDMLSDDS